MMMCYIYIYKAPVGEHAPPKAQVDDVRKTVVEFSQALHVGRKNYFHTFKTNGVFGLTMFWGSWDVTAVKAAA